MVDCVEHMLPGIAVKTAACMHRQGRGLVQHNHCLVLMQQLDLHVDVGFDHCWNSVLVALSGSYHLAAEDRLAGSIQHPALSKALLPDFSRYMGKHVAQRI